MAASIFSNIPCPLSAWCRCSRLPSSCHALGISRLWMLAGALDATAQPVIVVLTRCWWFSVHMLRRRYRAMRVHGIEARDVEAQRTHPQVCDNLGTCAVLPTAWNPGKVDRAPVPLERTLGVVGLVSSCRPLRFHWVSTARSLQSCLLAQLFCLATVQRSWRCIKSLCEESGQAALSTCCHITCCTVTSSSVQRCDVIACVPKL